MTKFCTSNGCGKVLGRNTKGGACRFHANQRRALTALEKKCAFEGCIQPVLARGFCNGHYQQNKRGKPLAELGPKPDEERFWERVDKDGPVHPGLGTRCWVWIGGRNNRGYGSFSFMDKTEAGAPFFRGARKRGMFQKARGITVRAFCTLATILLA